MIYRPTKKYTDGSNFFSLRFIINPIARTLDCCQEVAHNPVALAVADCYNLAAAALAASVLALVPAAGFFLAAHTH